MRACMMAKHVLVLFIVTVSLSPIQPEFYLNDI